MLQSKKSYLISSITSTNMYTYFLGFSFFWNKRMCILREKNPFLQRNLSSMTNELWYHQTLTSILTLEMCNLLSYFSVTILAFIFISHEMPSQHCGKILLEMLVWMFLLTLSKSFLWHIYLNSLSTHLVQTNVLMMLLFVFISMISFQCFILSWFHFSIHFSETLCDFVLW